MMGTDYEARFLELAARLGMETLRRECPCLVARRNHLNMITTGPDKCEACSINALYGAGHQSECDECNGVNWLPAPEAERLGALVRVAATKVEESVQLYPTCPTYLDDQFTPNRDYTPTGWSAELDMYASEGRFHIGDGPTPEAALVEALLAATQEATNAQRPAPAP